MEKSMEEHSKRAEPLSEELLDGVTGANNPTSFLNCRACQSEARQYDLYINVRDQHQNAVDNAVSHGNYDLADVLNHESNRYNQQAQQAYQQMATHGHPDFPAVLRQQRQNYNPRNSGYHPPH